MKREEEAHRVTAPNEIPSWELCKYFHPLPPPADEPVSLTFLINLRGVDNGWNGSNWTNGRMDVFGKSPHLHIVCTLVQTLFPLCNLARLKNK